MAMESPLVIVFDDLHWADEASLNLLLSLADLSGYATDLVHLHVCAPIKPCPSWDAINKIQRKTGREVFTPFQLEPLHVEQTDTLLANLLGVKDLPGNMLGI